MTTKRPHHDEERLRRYLDENGRLSIEDLYAWLGDVSLELNGYAWTSIMDVVQGDHEARDRAVFRDGAAWLAAHLTSLCFRVIPQGDGDRAA